ncbi:MAG: hypothetical protein ACRDYA_15525 [Egibacteraceae bacterium]
MTTKQPEPRPHDRTCAVQIRTRLLVEAGDPPEPPARLLHDIAQEIRKCCGHSLLKAHRLAYGWTVTAAVAALHTMCKDHKLGTRGLTARSWLQWEAGANPNSDYQCLLCRLFTTGPVQLGLATDYSNQDDGQQIKEPAAGALSWQTTEKGNSTHRRDAFRHVGAATVTPAAVSSALAEAAAEALAFTRRAQTSAVGPGALEHLELAVTEFNVAYARTPPAELFDAVRWYRREVDRLIAGPHTLREARELYAYAGWLSQLLASLALDLGHRTVAEAYGVDAWHHGREIGHDELCAWAMDAKATAGLYHNHQPDQALAAALQGAQHAPTGHPLAVRLVAKAAHAHARLDQREDFEAALRDAMDRYERLPAQAPTHFGVDSGLFAACAVTCYPASACIHLSLPEQARRHATDALALLAAAPEKDRSPNREGIARIDLALALIALGSPDEACGLGRQVLSSGRVAFYAVRAKALELDSVLQRDHPDLPEAQELHERCRLLAPPSPPALAT